MIRLTHDEVHTVLPAPPQAVYRLVTDVTRTPEWSPEVAACTWLDGADHAVVGARFAARNRRRWLRWTNRPVITAVVPNERFAFSRTEHGGGTMEWAYQLRPDASGTAVTLSYDVLRPVPKGLHIVLRVLFGVKDLQADLHENMRTSLERLARTSAAESTHTTPA